MKEEKISMKKMSSILLMKLLKSNKHNKPIILIVIDPILDKRMIPYKKKNMI